VLVGSDPLNKWLPWAIGFNPGPGDITYNAGADVITIHEAGVGAYAEDISGVWGGLPDRHIFLTVHIFDPADLDTGDADTILVSPPQATRLRTTDTPVVEIGSDTIECSITIIGATPTIECADPPDAEVGVAYTHQFAVSGGTVRVTGGALPPGLSVNAAGLVTGTPTTPGTFSFKVKTIA
jgi:hypothetical protein